MRHKKYKKNNGRFNLGDIERREASLQRSGFQPSKYLGFCRTLIGEGFSLRLYEARETASKYVTVEKDGKSFKVRFSNHRPLQHREARGDCDFFVGVNHTSVTTTNDALEAVRKFFSVDGTNSTQSQDQ